jgi:hypothetical protein
VFACAIRQREAAMALAPTTAGWLPRLALLAAITAAPALQAGPAPVFAAPGITLLAYGTYCPPPVEDEMAAPETESGIINLLADLPRIARNGQQVPAVLGMAFGVIYRSDHDLADVRFQALRPGRETPEIWRGAVTGESRETQGFTFETPDELEIGLWRLEAWEDDTLLYRAEFEVLPPDALPGLAQACGLTS